MSGVAECKNEMGFDYCGADWNSVDCAPATPCPRGDGCADGEKCIAYTNCGGTFSPSSTTQRLKVADLMPRLSRAPSSAEPRCSSWKTTAKVPLLVHMAPMIPPNPTRDAFQPRRAASPSLKLRKLFIHRRGEFYWCINKK